MSVISEGLRNAGGARTLLVLPEGVMINYLARVPSPIAQFFYFSTTTEQGGEERIVADLERRPARRRRDHQSKFTRIRHRSVRRPSRARQITFAMGR